MSPRCGGSIIPHYPAPAHDRQLSGILIWQIFAVSGQVLTVRLAGQGRSGSNNDGGWLWWPVGGVAALAGPGACAILLRARRG